MKLLWNWGGTFFGHRDGDNLWTHNGKHIGRFYDNEVYGPDGQYLGEIKIDDRLITCVGKKSCRKDSFMPDTSRAGVASPVGRVGYSMYAGYEDFPVPQ
jgi:hypothetical protein